MHIDLPDDAEGPEYKDLVARKAEKVADQATKADFNLEGAILPFLDFDSQSISSLNLVDAIIKGNTLFNKAIIKEDAFFEGATIGGDA